MFLQEFQQLLNNLEFAEKLAEKINKVKNKGENSGEEKLPEMSTQGPSEDKPDGCSPPHQVEPPIVHDIDTNFPFVSRQVTRICYVTCSFVFSVIMSPTVAKPTDLLPTFESLIFANCVRSVYLIWCPWGFNNL